MKEKDSKKEFKPWNYVTSVENLAPPGEKNQYIGLSPEGYNDEITLDQAREIDYYWALRRAVRHIEKERDEKAKRKRLL